MYVSAQGVLVVLSSRRQFLKFLGSTATLALGGKFFLLAGSARARAAEGSLPFQPISPSALDKLITAEGIHWELLVKWGDRIGGGKTFGYNNDYTAFIPFSAADPGDGVLLVNHESVNPLFVNNYSVDAPRSKTKAEVVREQEAVGCSLIRVHREQGRWKFDPTSKFNRRIDATTPIPFAGGISVDGSKQAIGTLANCAGGLTPWRTFLTCEENYDGFYGEWHRKPGKKSRSVMAKVFPKNDLGWTNHFDYSPSHYGWVVEIDPLTGNAKKHVALGRFAHECATCVSAKNGATVVYMGDDAPNQYLYKFVSAKKASLEAGTLFVADLKAGRWLPLVYAGHKEFKKRFQDQTDLLIHAREAAKILGATPLARPEDIEINPLNGDIIVALTNNMLEGNFHGSLLRIRENSGDFASERFSSETLVLGGTGSGLSCPDNLAFDKSGNLWVTSDMPGDRMNAVPYTQFKNNGLYYIPMHGASAGRVQQVASAPTDAEFTGVGFLPDGETMVLSVQHPGEQTSDLAKPTSRWPEGGTSLPKSAVVLLSGSALTALVNYKG